MRGIVQLSAVGLFVGLAMGVRADGRKLLIAHNWDLLAVGTEDVWRNREKFADVGFDGILFPLDRTLADGKTICGRDILTEGRFAEGEFARTAKLAQECLQLRGLRESFALFSLIPVRRLSWRDDEAWGRATANIAVFSKVAKAVGFRGLAIDHEDYTKQKQFRLVPEDGDYDDASRLARQRGREFFGALFEAFPDAKILAFWLFSEMDGIVSSPYEPTSVAGYGTLWISFLDGLLDVIPPKAKIIDGNEDSAYKCDDPDGFHRLAVATHLKARALVSPENRAKYAAQISASFGQYVESYVVSTNSRWHIGMLDGSRLKRFQRNLASAVEQADDLVWVYGETGTLVDWDVKKDRRTQYPTWESRLPGFAQMLRTAVGDRDVIRRMVADGTMTNLAENAGCDGVGASVPAGFGTWTREKNPPADLFSRSESEGLSRPGALRLAGKGSFSTSAIQNLKPGDVVYVRVMVKGRHPSLSIGWKKDFVYDWSKEQGWLQVASEASSDGWQLYDGSFLVPEGINGLGLVMAAPWSERSPVYFDDIGIYRRAINYER